MRSSLRTCRGFTLIELLVVVSIIAMLAAILLPVTARARGYARKMACVSHLSQLGQALNLYVDACDHWYPCACCMPSTEPKDGLPRIRDLLEPYTKSGEVFRCSDDHPTDPEYKFPSYFEGEGSSYEWAEILNHLKAGTQPRFVPFKLDIIPILRDYEGFHRRGGSKVGMNSLFVDFHVESF
jgi:prepilin-type N-terminal cleavage/methylation domain-containing protein